MGKIFCKSLKNIWWIIKDNQDGVIGGGRGERRCHLYMEKGGYGTVVESQHNLGNLELILGSIREVLDRPSRVGERQKGKARASPERDMQMKTKRRVPN